MGFFEKTIGRGNFWTFLIGLGLSIWGALALADMRYWPGDRISGSPWILLPGGIMLLIAFSNIYMYRYNRERILGTLKSYQRISINQIATELRMKEKDVKDMIIDLRTEGKLKASSEWSK